MNGIQLIKSDVKDFIDNRLRREEEFERSERDIRKMKEERLFDAYTAEMEIMYNADMFNTMDNLDHVLFKDNMKTDFQRVFDRIYMEAVDIDNWWDIRTGLRMYHEESHDILNKLQRELWEIKETILKKVSHRRFRYYKNSYYRREGFIKKPYKDILKEDEILQSIYDGTIFSHVEEVLFDLGIEV